MIATKNSVDATRARTGDRRWPLALTLLAVLGCAANTLIFWPGFMSPDSVGQLDQAKTGVFNDWHPPILALLWRGLIELTGTVGSMLLLQTLVEWTALWGLAMLAYRNTRSKGWSSAALAIGILPFVVNISGVIWKDVQMALALLAAVVLTLWLPHARKRRFLFVLGVGAVILLLAYAVLVRKNAVVAVLPLLFLLHLSWPRPRIGRLVGLVALLAVTIVGLQTMVNVVARPAASGMSQFIAVDDIVHVMSAEEIRGAGFSPDLERRLLITQDVCQRDDIIFNAYLSCYPFDAGVDPIEAGAKHGPEIQDRWPGLMARRPVAYLNYRLEAFSTYLFNYRSVWVDGVYPNQYGITPRSERLAESLHMYVNRTDISLGIVFVPAVWWLLSVLLMFHRRAGNVFGTAVRMLGLSCFLYISSYFPVAPAVDYRYTYWPVIACCVGGLLFAIERNRPAPRDAEEA